MNETAIARIFILLNKSVHFYIVIPLLGFKPSKYHSSLNSGALRFTHVFIKKFIEAQRKLNVRPSTHITFENELLKVKTKGV